MAYEIVLSDHTVQIIDDADTYKQEGPLTTFFRTEGARRVVDAWSTRLGSFRTAEILAIRFRAEPREEPAVLGAPVRKLRPA